MRKTYKGYELLNLIGENKIKKGTKFKAKIKDAEEIVIFDGKDLNYEDVKSTPTFFFDYYLLSILNGTFIIIEKEIDIQNIEEYKEEYIEIGTSDSNIKSLAKKCNELIKAVKQLDKKISNKEVKIEKS